MNKQLHDEIMEYINAYELKPSDYLFMGQKKRDTYKGNTRDVIYPIDRKSVV